LKREGLRSRLRGSEVGLGRKGGFNPCRDFDVIKAPERLRATRAAVKLARMAEILFYHLERASLESTLPGLLEKTLERGWKAVVRASSRERVAALDAHLWTFREDSFLPHASGGEASFAALQPIWLTDRTDAPNGADVLFLVDGAAVDVAETGRYARAVVIFDGADESAVAAARDAWKSVRDAGLAATYWKQSEGGRWEKQA